MDWVTQMSAFLRDTQVGLVNYLGGILPRLSENWWEDLVKPHLSDEQLQRLGGRRELAVLDLIALLRTFERNWSRIAGIEGLSREGFHYLKGMCYVRNRWAHAGTDPIPPEDIHSDLDTVKRFLSTIGGSAELVERVKKAMREALHLEGDPGPSTEPEDPEPEEQGPEGRDARELVRGECLSLVRCFFTIDLTYGELQDFCDFLNVVNPPKDGSWRAELRRCAKAADVLRESGDVEEARREASHGGKPGKDRVEAILQVALVRLGRLPASQQVDVMKWDPEIQRWQNRRSWERSTP